MASSGVPICRKVFVDCDRVSRLPYGKIVYNGWCGDGVRVIYVYPSPKCVLAPTTIISFSETVSIVEKPLRNNIALIVEKRGGKRKKYVYPRKTYLEFKKLYVEPILNGEPPFSSGVVFAGAPGTGKSTLATLIAQKLGIPTYVIDPTIQSKWVGDSEQRLMNVIEEAKQNAPSLVIMDDAEWILSPRSLAGGEKELQVLVNMQNILFKQLQEITDKELNVLFIATTNVKLSEIDEAFKRYGRFGETILFPLPDYEAVYEVLREIVDEATAVRLARMAVNSGLNMADALGLAKRVKHGLEPEIKEKTGRGYKRIYVEKIEGFEKIFMFFPKEVFEKRSRIYVPGQEDVITAVVTQILYSAEKTVLQIIDPRHVIEAVHMANITGSGIIVSSLLDPLILDYIHKNADTPVIYVGESPPRYVPYHMFYPLPNLKRIVGYKPIVEAVAKMYNVDIPDNLWRKIENASVSDKTFEEILKTMISLGVLTEKIISTIKTHT